MKKILLSLILVFFSVYCFSQSYSYITAVKSGAALYQYGTITTPTGTDTTIAFQGYFGKPHMIFVDCRTLDANNTQLDIGVRGLNMDTVFMSLDTLKFPLTVDTTVYTDKVVSFKQTHCYSPELVIKLTKGSATAGLEVPIQIFTEK